MSAWILEYTSFDPEGAVALARVDRELPIDSFDARGKAGEFALPLDAIERARLVRLLDGEAQVAVI